MTPQSSATLRPRSSLDPHVETQDELVLEIDGRAFAGWKSFRLSRELQSCCGAFELGASIERPWPIRDGAEARVLLGRAVVAHGFVDSIFGSLSDAAHEITVAGRDATADLVDCSIHEDLEQVSNLFLDELVELAASPYNVTTEVRETGPIFPDWKFDQGASAWSTIEKACRLRGKLAYPTASGALRVDRPGASTASRTIVEGEAAFSMRWESRDRFQTYVVRGQRPGSDSGWGAAVSQIQAVSRDFGIARPRTLVVLAESAVDQTNAEERAAWERAVRSARSASLIVDLEGWRQSDGGPLWELNQLVSVEVPTWSFRATLLVDGLEFSLDETAGRRARLRLVRASSYLAEPRANEPDPFDSWAESPAAEAEDE